MQIGSRDPSDLKVHVSNDQKSGRCCLYGVTTVLLLMVTNAATAFVAIYVERQRSSATTSAPALVASPLAESVFSAQHSIPGSNAAAQYPRPNISYARMRRAELSYANHPMSAYVVAAGVCVILDANLTATHEVHTEVVNGSTFGEFTQAHGRVGTKALQVRFVDLATRSEGILIPMSFSVRKGGPTLVPNLFFFSHRAAPTARPTTSFVSAVTGSFVFQNHSAAAAWEATMTPAFVKYAEAWLASHPGAAPSRRRLGVASWLSGKLGGWLGDEATGGSSYGGALGSAVGSIGAGLAYGDETAGDAADTIGMHLAGTAATKLGGALGGDAFSAAADMADGESAGDAIGSVAGGAVGSDVGRAVGADVGGAAGAALGTAIGGPAGGVVGEEAGAWAGGLAGGYVGGKIGKELGGDVGSDVEDDARNAWDDVSSDASSAWDDMMSYGSR